jgi:hypothetical protein
LVSQVDGAEVRTPAELEASLRQAIADEKSSVRFAVRVADSERVVSLHLGQLLGVE